MLYLFIGEDSLSKNIKLKSLKEEILPKDTQEFNFDTLYARELILKELQEKLLNLPFKSAKRIILIREADRLKAEVKEYLVNYARKKDERILLILDIERFNLKDEFIRGLSGLSRVFRFRESAHPDTFTLSRSIRAKRPDYALKILNRLLLEGEKPERILGGLRFAVEKDSDNLTQMQRLMKLLLNCDMDIKTGRLKPNFALEKLVVNLCNAVKALA